MIQNPILPGFCPDPSIIRVEDDYYIATSSFEWWPGVKIYHSKDLQHYEQLPSPLNRLSQLNMIGEADSCGVWAPDISWDGEYYWLIYTDVKTRTSGFFNTHNYLVRTKDIRGSWSEPVYLNSTGFDPSFFHDTDGKKYVVNMINNFKGILVQEYDPVKECLVGEAKNVFAGTGRNYTEGPHIYHIGEYYYLLMAEGGTSYGHMVTMARARSIWGPYEEDPGNPVLTSDVENPEALQRCGHGDLVCTQNGEWYMVHLCSRTLKGERKSVLGRETSIQKMTWNEEGWLRMACGGRFGQMETESPAGIEEYLFPEEDEKNYGREEFDFDGKGVALAGDERSAECALSEDGTLPAGNTLSVGGILSAENCFLDVRYTSLRQPYGSFASITERPGYLRLYGQESLNSCYHVSLIARRQQAKEVQVETCVEFEPKCREQMAGLAYMYDTGNYYLLVKTREEEYGSPRACPQNHSCSLHAPFCGNFVPNSVVIARYDALIRDKLSTNCDTHPAESIWGARSSQDLTKPAKLRLIRSSHFAVSDVIPSISIPETGRLYLRIITVNEGLNAKFFYSLDGENYVELAEVPTDILTDEQSEGFTGAHFGMYCHDMTGQRRYGDFDYFEIKRI